MIADYLPNTTSYQEWYGILDVFSKLFPSVINHTWKMYYILSISPHPFSPQQHERRNQTDILLYQSICFLLQYRCKHGLKNQACS